MTGPFQLGVNGLFHDAAVCLLEDGRPVLAVEEERLDRRRHSGGFPERGIALALERAGIGLGDLETIAFSWRPGPLLRHQGRLAAARLPESLRLLAPGATAVGLPGKLGWLLGMRRRLARRFGAPRRDVRLRFVPHHVAHAYDAFAASGFGQAAVLVIDGFGEVASTSCFRVGERGIERVFSIPYPDSLGMLYGAVTEYLGFRAMHDEYKVMGLAAFGEDRHAAAFDRILAPRPNGRYRLDPASLFVATHGRNRWFGPRLEALLGPPRAPGAPLADRHRDVASGLQRAVERAGLALAREAHRRTGLTDLCLAGGVAQNVCLNARIAEEGPFRRVFVPPAPGDAGTAHGAVQAVRARRPGWRREPWRHAYLGPSWSAAQCAAALARAGLEGTEVGDVTGPVVDLLRAGRVVGVFRGAMEFGPRALGNRSLLADPRCPEMRDRINATIKRRESFRPFAPVVPLECAGELFHAGPPSPYMSFVARARPGTAARVPAVIHIDGTARVQTLRRADNPWLWQVLMDFGAATGVPVLLNTSFNEDEPIVCSPDEAVSCFLRTPLDALLLGGWLVRRDAKGG